MIKRKSIYVASSWKNDHQPEVVDALRKDGHGVYDFRNPENGNTGFSWRQVTSEPKPWNSVRMRTVLRHPISSSGFLLDFRAMQSADACVLVTPCGNSSHLEAGWLASRGVFTVVYAPVPIEPELMYLLLGSSVDEPQVWGTLDCIRRLMKGEYCLP